MGGWVGAHEILNYRIIVDFFENYRNQIYRHHSIFYQKLYIIVTVRWLKYRMPSICYPNNRNTVQKLANTEYRHIVRSPKWWLQLHVIRESPWFQCPNVSSSCKEIWEIRKNCRPIRPEYTLPCQTNITGTIFLFFA